MTVGTRSIERPVRRIWHAFAADRTALAALAVLLALLLAAALLPPVLPGGSAAPPSPAGDAAAAPACPRDAPACAGFARGVAVALQHSLGNAFLAVGLAALIGVPWGLAGSLLPPRGRRWLMGPAEVPRALPPVLVVVAVLAVLALPTAAAITLPVIFAACLAPHWAALAGERAGRELGRDYALVARRLGLSRLRVLLVHVLPNIAPWLLVAALAQVAFVLAAEPVVALAGIGFPAGHLALGPWLAAVASVPAATAPSLWPGLLLAVITAGFALAALGLRRALARSIAP